MRIEIGAIVEEARRNVYELQITFMSGDADAYETESYIGTEEFLSPALQWLLAFDAEEEKGYAHGYAYGEECAGRTPHEELPGAHAFEGWAPWPWPADLPKCVQMTWPRDVTGDGPAALDCWKLFFYDADGHKHSCKVTQ